ncbi:MAG: hypothetical protein FWG55_05340 [Candidatus Bathyarchaeota archaeon]|nr:hypothetical protein [Candidatus Termiticorpusculum sp.]
MNVDVEFLAKPRLRLSLSLTLESDHSIDKNIALHNQSMQYFTLSQLTLNNTTISLITQNIPLSTIAPSNLARNL